MIKNHSRSRKVASVIAALAVGAASFLGASAAQAAETVDYGNIDFDRTGSLTIHKHEHQSTNDETAVAPDASGDTSSFGAGVDGVTFSIQKINEIDLADQSDWALLDGLTPNTDGTVTGYTLTSAGEVVTSNGGVATIAGLELGAYVVTETDAPSSVVDHATPFIVTLPLPYDGGWLYNVHAYPKNGVTDITKNVEAPSGLGLGSTVNFPVTTKVPTVATNGSITSYVVSDTLDARLGSLAVPSVTNADGSVTFVDGTDYDVVVNGSTVQVVFTASGLERLAADFEGQNIVTTFQGTVTSVGDGEIVNDATVFVNDPEQTDGVDSNEVVTKWGNLRIQKINDVTPATALQGATFEVYAAADAYAADCSAATPTGDAISINGATSFTSNENGLVEGIDGLFVSDTNTGSLSDTRCYVLKETAAPAGYVLPEGDNALFAVTVVAGTTADAEWDAQIENSQPEVPSLPMTGAQGQLLMAIGGAALLAIALGLVMARRRANAAK